MNVGQMQSSHSDEIQAGIDPFTLVKEMGKLGCNL